MGFYNNFGGGRGGGGERKNITALFLFCMKYNELRVSDIYFVLKVAARTLRIPASKIHISETSTNTVPNTSATAASASSDLNGMAIQVRILIFKGNCTWNNLNKNTKEAFKILTD